MYPYFMIKVHVTSVISIVLHYIFKLFYVHGQLRKLHTSLSLLPKCTPVLPTLKEVDPVYKLLDHLNIEVSGTPNLLSTVSQELMTLSLAIPGVNRERER